MKRTFGSAACRCRQVSVSVQGGRGVRRGEKRRGAVEGRGSGA